MVEDENLLDKLKKETPVIFQEFYDWYYGEFGIFVYGQLAALEDCPIDFLITLLKSFLKEKKELKIENEKDIYFAFKTLE